MRRFLCLGFLAASLALLHCSGDGTKLPSAVISAPPTDGLDGSAPTPIGTSPLSLPKTSAGCGKAVTPAAAGAPRTLQVGSASRTYLLYLPEGYDPAAPIGYPVISVWHYSDASAADMTGYYRMQDYARGKAIVVFPNALNGNWNPEGTEDLAFFDAMEADLEANFCVNRQRVFAAGFSLGAIMTNAIGCKRSAFVRAIVSASGSFPGDSTRCGKTPALVYHGTFDDAIPVADGVAARDAWRRLNGCGNDPIPVESFGLQGLGCIGYGNCDVAYCEDKGNADPKHDLRELYRIPTYTWLSHFE